MKLIEGRLDYAAGWEWPDVYLFTGNPCLRKDGAVVMGRGAAKEVRDNYNGVGYALGERLRDNPDSVLEFVTISDIQSVGWFRVKDHFYDPARLYLIQLATRELAETARLFPQVTYHMNFPGIGNGRLEYEKVLPILEELPDNVLIYKSP